MTFKVCIHGSKYPYLVLKMGFVDSTIYLYFLPWQKKNQYEIGPCNRVKVLDRQRHKLIYIDFKIFIQPSHVIWGLLCIDTLQFHNFSYLNKSIQISTQNFFVTNAFPISFRNWQVLTGYIESLLHNKTCF